jgi:heme/copper-type cytochrome/quinol oxidase subunit 2
VESVNVASTAVASVDWLLIALFVTVGALLVYGGYAFRRSSATAGDQGVPGGRTANPMFDVLWTSLAALLLLGVFLYAR